MTKLCIEYLEDIPNWIWEENFSDDDDATGTKFISWERRYKILQEYVEIRIGHLPTYEDNDKKTRSSKHLG